MEYIEMEKEPYYGKSYEVDVDEQSMGTVDVTHDLFPHRFFVWSYNGDDFGRWLGRMLIKANLAGLRGQKIERVKVTHRVDDDPHKGLMELVFETKTKEGG